MTLQSVDWLWLLWVIPVVVGVVVLAERRAQVLRTRFVGALHTRLVQAPGAHAQRAALLVAALIAAIVGLARPAWGVYYEEVQSEGVDVVVLLDVSRSMLAEDAVPNRLGRAQIAIEKLIDRLDETGGHRVGLVAFAGTPSVRCPLTRDYDYVRETLARTDPTSVSRGGTLIGDAVRRGLDLLSGEGEQWKALILLTDGEDQESFPVEAARRAAGEGVSIYAIGIGDAGDGAPIPLRADDGSVTYVQHDGERVVTRLDEETLLEMTRLTGGAYVPAGTRTIPLDRIYDDAVASRTGALHGATKEKRLHERFHWAVGLAILLAMASRFAGPRAESRSREATMMRRAAA